MDNTTISTMSVSEMDNMKMNNEIDVDKYIEEPHTIIDSCFRGRHLKRLIEHQIESYNDFIEYQVPRTISMFNPIHIFSEQDFNKELNTKLHNALPT